MESETSFADLFTVLRATDVRLIRLAGLFGQLLIMLNLLFSAALGVVLAHHGLEDRFDLFLAAIFAASLLLLVYAISMVPRNLKSVLEKSLQLHEQKPESPGR